MAVHRRVLSPPPWGLWKHLHPFRGGTVHSSGPFPGGPTSLGSEGLPTSSPGAAAQTEAPHISNRAYRPLAGDDGRPERHIRPGPVRPRRRLPARPTRPGLGAPGRHALPWVTPWDPGGRRAPAAGRGLARRLLPKAPAQMESADQWPMANSRREQTTRGTPAGAHPRPGRAPTEAGRMRRVGDEGGAAAAKSCPARIRPPPTPGADSRWRTSVGTKGAAAHPPGSSPASWRGTQPGSGPSTIHQADHVSGHPAPRGPDAATPTPPPLQSPRGGGTGQDRYLVDPASSHMLVSKIKPCMCQYKQNYTVKLRMAH